MDKKATKKEEWKAQTKEQENRRPLTKAEQLRKERFEAQKAELEAQGYRTEDLTIGLVYANVMAIVLGLPVVIILGICFFLKTQLCSGERRGRPLRISAVLRRLCYPDFRP